MMLHPIANTIYELPNGIGRNCRLACDRSHFLLGRVDLACDAKQHLVHLCSVVDLLFVVNARTDSYVYFCTTSNHLPALAHVLFKIGHLQVKVGQTHLHDGIEHHLLHQQQKVHSYCLKSRGCIDW